MKKLLLGTMILLIIILTGVTMVEGVQIGEIKILGIKEIRSRNIELDESIKQATKLASTDYQKKIDDLNETIKSLEKEKQTYEDMVNVSTESEVEASKQSYENKVEFLFIRIENHAKSEGVQMKMEVARSTSGAEDVYNLNFTVIGGYAQIEEFITNIEDDSKLGYKIEEFKMVSSKDDDVQATFVCRDIKITGISSNTTINTTTTTIDTTNTTVDNTKENKTEE